VASITATADALRAQVRLDINFSDVNAPAVTVTRTNLLTGATATVRGYGSTLSGATTTLLGRLVLYDTEAPLDVPLLYTATYNSGTGLVVLNSNPYFENGQISPWVGQNAATVAATSTQFHQGGWSMLVTPDGVTAVPQASSEEVVATPAKSYTLSGWLRTTSNATRNLAIFWFDAAHAFLSSSQISTALIAGTWTRYGPSAFTSPANTAFARIATNDSGTPAAVNTWQGDELTIATTVNATATTSTPVTVPSNGVGWLKDPVRPVNNVQLDTRRPAYGGRGAGVGSLGLGDQVDAANASLFGVNNSAYPVAVSRIRDAPTSSLRMAARSKADIDALKLLFAAGGQLQLQLPPAYGEDDRYLQPANVTRSPVFVDQRRQRRVFSVPFATTASQAGPMQGTAGVRWADLCAHTATWGAVLAAQGGTFDQFARTVGSGAWGAPDVSPSAGATWTVAGVTTDLSVSAGAGQIGLSVVNTSDRATIGSVADFEAYMTCTVPVVATGAPYQVMILGRHVDSSNYYRLGLQFGLAGATTIMVVKRVATVETTVASIAGPTYAAGQVWRMHAVVLGTALKVSSWKDGTPEPVEFSVSTTDAALGAAAPYGVYARLNTANTNTLPVLVTVDDFQVKGAVTWQGILDGALS
jgi:hypothetical protein